MSDLSSKIYVDNLPPSVDENSLTCLFSLCGRIKKAEVYSYETKYGIQKHGIITFVDEKLRDKALLFRQHYYRRYIINVIKAEKADYSVTYNGIHQTLTESVFTSKIKTLFPGKVISVKYMKNVENSFAVYFKDEETRQTALNTMAIIDEISNPICSMKAPEPKIENLPVQDCSYTVHIQNIQNIQNFLGLFEPYKINGELLTLQRSKDYALLLSFNGSRPNDRITPVQIRPHFSMGVVDEKTQIPVSPKTSKKQKNAKLNNDTSNITTPEPNNHFYDTVPSEKVQNDSREQKKKKFSFTVKVTNVGNKTKEELEEYFCEDRKEEALAEIQKKQENGKRCALLKFKHEKDYKAALEISGQCYLADDDPITVTEWKLNQKPISQPIQQKNIGSTTSAKKNFPFIVKVTNIGTKSPEELENYFCPQKGEAKAEIQKENGERFALLKFMYEKHKNAALDISGRCYLEDVNPITVNEWKKEKKKPKQITQPKKQKNNIGRKNFPFAVKVTNIGTKTTEELENIFCLQKGEAKAVIIKENVCFAIVNFKHEADQKKALDYSGKCYFDPTKPINVIIWEKKPLQKIQPKKQQIFGSTQSLGSLTNSISTLSLGSFNNYSSAALQLSGYQIVVHNVPDHMDSKDIKGIFQCCGTIIAQPTFEATANGNMAFIEFKEKFAVEKACHKPLPHGMFAYGK